MLQKTKVRISTATFPRVLHSAPPARRFVTEAAGTHPAADDAVLVAAELISNSLLHASDATALAITVTVSRAFIRVAVYDDGTIGIPHLRQAADHSEDGRGFHLVNHVARRWGFTREKARTCCWAEVATTHPATPS